MLTVFDEIFLLAIDDTKGKVVAPAAPRLPAALAAGVLVELIIQGKICIRNDRRIELREAEKTGDPILDDTLKKIAEERPRKATFWIKALSAHPKRWLSKMGKRLVKGGILSQDDDQLVLNNYSPLENVASEMTKFEIKNRLRSAVLANSDPDLPTLGLLGVAKASRLLNLIFTRDERALADRRIYEKLTGEALEDLKAQSLQEIEEALEGFAD